MPLAVPTTHPRHGPAATPAIVHRHHVPPLLAAPPDLTGFLRNRRSAGHVRGSPRESHRPHLLPRPAGPYGTATRPPAVPRRASAPAASCRPRPPRSPALPRTHAHQRTTPAAAPAPAG